MALAVLVFGCVFAATAGSREALSTRTQAVRQTLAATSPLAQTITATSTWTGLTEDLGIGNEPAARTSAGLTAAQLGELTSQLRDDFDRGLIHLGPADTDWLAMTSQPHNVMSNLGAAAKNAQVKLESHVPAAAYPVHAAGAAGRYPGTVPRAARASAAAAGRGDVADRRRLRPARGLEGGDQRAGDLHRPARQARSRSEVTGIVAPRTGVVVVLGLLPRAVLPPTWS